MTAPILRRLFNWTGKNAKGELRDPDEPLLVRYSGRMVGDSDILILGASTRAAASSAVRAGLQPICADRFGDEDLRRIARVLPINDYPRDLLHAVAALQPTPWIYTGAIENEPHLIAQVCQRHPLLGNPPDVLRRVRDPFWIERTLRRRNLPTLQTRTIDDPPPADDDWLIKPLRSAGGSAIRVWGRSRGRISRASYFQERRDGRAMSALFVASIGGAKLLGVCEQLIGREAGAPSDFHYAGSIGPLPIGNETLCDLLCLGQVIADEAGLRGLFGIDFILADDVSWVVELNPRYTASVEVLERATKITLVAQHLDACLASGTRESWNFGHRGEQTTCAATVAGKQIVYAAHEVIAPDLEKLLNHSHLDADESCLADIPKPGSRIAASWPICTVFANAADAASCRLQLSDRAQSVWRSILAAQ